MVIQTHGGSVPGTNTNLCIHLVTEIEWLGKQVQLPPIHRKCRFITAVHEVTRLYTDLYI